LRLSLEFGCEDRPSESLVVFDPCGCFSSRKGFLLHCDYCIHLFGPYKRKSPCKEKIFVYNFGMAKKRGSGRPKTKDPTDNVAAVLTARVTLAERQAFERAADKANLRLSAWVRKSLLRAAKGQSKRD
jgi:hypothetical protein